MKLIEAKENFIEAWGIMSSNWGINRTMAQIHALLLISDNALSTDDIMEKLQISRGNANMNLRELINWGLVDRKIQKGERMEYFTAEKDMWKVAMRIIKERRKRELEPLKSIVNNLQDIEDKQANKTEYTNFKNLIAEIEDIATTADKLTDKFIGNEKNFVLLNMMKFLAK